MRELNNMESFKRDISYQALVLEDKSISLTGTLKDRFHDIKVEIIVDSLSLEILSSQCHFAASPSSYCHLVEERVGLLKGIVIGKGLSRRLNEVLGGSDGCGNLRTLFIGLLPLALNVKASMGLVEDEEILATIHHQLQGSCVGYPVLDNI